MVGKDVEQSPSRTPYEEIKDLEGKMREMDHERYVRPGGSVSLPYRFIVEVRSELEGGSSVSIMRPFEVDQRKDGKMEDSQVCWVNIGGFGFIVTPAKVELNMVFPVQLQIGNKSEEIETRLKMQLDRSGQKAVLDWMRTSIEQRKLGESPVKINLSSLGQKS